MTIEPIIPIEPSSEVNICLTKEANNAELEYYKSKYSSSKLLLFNDSEKKLSFLDSLEEIDYNPTTLFFIASINQFEDIFYFLIKKGIGYQNIINPKIPPREISIGGKPYIFEELLLTVPAKPLDIDIASANLIDFSSHLDKVKLTHFLMFGTLLGAIRDGDFIKHDLDTDIAIYYEDMENLLQQAWNFEKIGFKLVRITDNFITFYRNGEIIDVYSFKLHKTRFKKYWYCNLYVIPYKHFKKLNNHFPYKGKTFSIPTDVEGVFVSLYGKDWKTPIKDKHAKMTEFKPSISRVLIAKLIPSKIKKTVKNIFRLQ